MKDIIKSYGINPLDGFKPYRCADDYLEIIEQLLINSDMQQVLSENGCNEYVKGKGKEYIMYELLYILNKLKRLSNETIECYLLDTNLLLEEIIRIVKEEKGWDLNMMEALLLATCIVLDYVESCTNVAVEPLSEKSALRQIIRKYSEYMVEHRIYDEEFLEPYCEMLKVHEDPEYKLFYNKNEDILRQLVQNRIYLHDIYC